MIGYLDATWIDEKEKLCTLANLKDKDRSSHVQVLDTRTFIQGLKIHDYVLVIKTGGTLNSFWLLDGLNQKIVENTL